MQTAVLVVGVGILATIAYGDVRTRRIPNALSLAIAILGLLRIVLVHDPVAAGYTLAAGAAVFVAAFLLFWRGAIGGGDAKLVTAMALLVSYRDLFSFLFLMSVCGGALALAILARDKFRQRLLARRGGQASRRRRGSPDASQRRHRQPCLTASQSPPPASSR